VDAQAGTGSVRAKRLAPTGPRRQAAIRGHERPAETLSSALSFSLPKAAETPYPNSFKKGRYPAYFHLEQKLREGYHGRLFLGTTKKQDIILSTDNDNSFDWAIPSSLPAGSNFKIKITTLDGKIMATGSNFVLN